MTSSADQEVTQNLISTVGGEVTIPVPVKSRGFVLKQGRFIASVKDSVLEIENFDFLNRFSWDRASGLFSIRRLQRKDSGDYSVDVNETAVSFKLSVYDAVLKPDVNVTSGSNESCTLLCAVDQLSGGTLSWYQGEVLVNQSSTQRSLPLTVDRLGLRSSYRCVSANPAGNLTRSVEPKTSCPVEQLTGDEDEEESNRLFRILIPIFPVAAVISVCVIVFFVVKRRKRAKHRQASILSALDATPKVGALWVPIYSLVHLTTVLNHSSIPKGLHRPKDTLKLYLTNPQKDIFKLCFTQLHLYSLSDNSLHTN
ncbi:uncharacterized protein LOC130379825 isoform X2 [Gadus chalcogrammus]|nr:uncharacterized protein LOC130379825 isoform X2 [Gadus chalcogrammus]